MQVLVQRVIGVYAFCFTELQINFEELDYSINEGESTANKITMQYRRTENDFTLRLTPVSIADSESMYDVVAFVDPAEFVARATTGDIYAERFVCIYRGHNNYVLIQLHLHTFFTLCRSRFQQCTLRSHNSCWLYYICTTP